MESWEQRMEHRVTTGNVAGATIAVGVCIAAIALAVSLIDRNRLSAGIPIPTGALFALASLLTP
jgi:hypothetical protein